MRSRIRMGCLPGYYLCLLLTFRCHVEWTQRACWCEKEVNVLTPGSLCLLNDKANIMPGCVLGCRCYRVRQVISSHSTYAIERRYTTFCYMSAWALLHTHFVPVRHDQSLHYFYLFLFLPVSFGCFPCMFHTISLFLFQNFSCLIRNRVS
jgi:hypothetical protein